MSDEVQVDDPTICRWLANTLAHELAGTAIATYRSGGARPLFAYLGHDQRLSDQVSRLERAIEAWAGLDDPRLELASDFTTLFLGGFSVPFWPGAPWFIAVPAFMAKTAVFLFLFLWVRWTLPRLRYDQLMDLGWKRLFPLALVNLFVTALLVTFEVIQR